MNIQIVGIDPAIRNFGYAQAVYDVKTQSLSFTTVRLVSTEKDTCKTVRRNSDDLRRAATHLAALRAMCAGMNLAVAEIPTGTQSARGAMSNGISIGILAACPLPLIQVLPHEVKMAAVGHKQAAKEEMIEWAMSKYPHLPWLLQEKNGKGFKKGEPVAANEHLADAVAIVHAGIATEQFAQALSIANEQLARALSMAGAPFS